MTWSRPPAHRRALPRVESCPNLLRCFTATPRRLRRPAITIVPAECEQACRDGTISTSGDVDGPTRILAVLANIYAHDEAHTSPCLRARSTSIGTRISLGTAFRTADTRVVSTHSPCVSTTST